MALRLIVPLDEEMIPRLLPGEMIAGSRPNVRENEREKSPGFQASEFQARQVGELLALGLPVEKISQILKVTPVLLQFYYAQEFETAEALVNAKVAKVALDMALSGRNPEMTQFWLKSRAGWCEKNRLEITGADGGPIEITQAREGLMKLVLDHEETEQLAPAAAQNLLTKRNSAVFEGSLVEDVIPEESGSSDDS